MEFASSALIALFATRRPRGAKILMLSGSNLNRLGKRDPRHYGTKTLSQLEEAVIEVGTDLGVSVVGLQSNCEGALIDALHAADDDFHAVLFNPGGYTHTSIALRDAIEAITAPVYEVHISNVHNREEFRSQSMISAVCAGTVSGCGEIGYTLALIAAVSSLNEQTAQS